MAVAVKATAILHRQPPVPILTQRRAADLLNVRRKIIGGSPIDGIDLSKSYSISSASGICRSTSTSATSDEIRDDEVLPITPLEVNQIKDMCSKWEWRGYTINYLKYEGQNCQKSNPPLLLVHGFGASVAHWRRNIPTLGQTNTVYAIDLLGFGASDKPAGFEYTMEAWAQLILDFVDEIVQRPTVLIGNSVGSLACVIAAAGVCFLWPICYKGQGKMHWTGLRQKIAVFCPTRKGGIGTHSQPLVYANDMNAHVCFLHM